MLINEYVNNIDLSNAAYADLNGIGEIERENGIINPESNNAKKAITALTNSKVGFTRDQAIAFLNKYDITYHHPNDETGLSFTVFTEVGTKNSAIATFKGYFKNTLN